MYVLMDMEWVENKNGQLHLTQIAAIRVDENWNAEKTFFTRIQPPDESFCLWDHVGYTGGYANEFLSAPPTAEVVKMLYIWLQKEDILCWWWDNAIALFREKFPQIQQTHISIFPYLCHYLRHTPFLIGSAYHILGQLTIDLPGKQHHAETDIPTGIVSELHSAYIYDVVKLLLQFGLDLNAVYVTQYGRYNIISIFHNSNPR